jgi:uncharacterized membrane protein
MRALLTSLPLWVALAACGEDEPKDDTAPQDTQGETEDGIVHYDQEVQPILDNRCATCHRGASPPHGIDLSSYDAVMASGTVVAFDSAASELITVGSHRGSGWFTADEQYTVEMWIDSGAENL